MSDSVRSLIWKPVRFAQRHGLLRAVYFLVHGTISRFRLEKWIRFSISDILCGNVSELVRESRMPKAFRIALAAEEDIPALAAEGRKPELVRARLGESDLCLLLWSGSELKAYEWIAVGPREYWEDWNEARIIIRIPAGCCWTYDGRGHSPGAWGMIMRTLPKEVERNSIRRIYQRVDYASPISWHSHRSAGYLPLARVFHVGVGHFGFTLWRQDQGKWHSLPARVQDLELVTPSIENISRQLRLFPMYLE